MLKCPTDVQVKGNIKEKSYIKMLIIIQLKMSK